MHYPVTDNREDRNILEEKMETSKPDKLSLAQYENIQLRVGRLPTQRLQWALQFAHTNLDTLMPGEFLDLRSELNAFAFSLIWWDRLSAYQRQKFRQKLGNATIPRRIPPDPSEEETRTTQAEFNKVLGNFGQHGRATVGPFPVTYLMQRQTTPPEKLFKKTLSAFKNPSPAGMLSFHKANPIWFQHVLPFYADKPAMLIEGGFENRALVKFAELLAGHSALVRDCPREGCSRWFVAARLNQAYCGKRCQSLVNTRKYREKMEARKKQTTTKKTARRKGRKK